MDPVTNSGPASPSGNPHAVNTSPHRGCDVPLQSLDGPSAPVIARRRVTEAGAFGSPARRSPRLSCLPPPQPPPECRNAQDPDESSDDESESVNDVALHLSREETPENEALAPDEPSTVLANRIIRAHDNPSPPPQDLAHPGINYIPGKDGQFPLLDMSAPLSPFRPINLLERLNQLSDPSFDPPYSFRTPVLGDRLEIPEPAVISTRGSILPESRSPLVASTPTKSKFCEGLATADTVPSSSTQCTIGDPSRLMPHVCDPPNPADHIGVDTFVAGLRQLITTSSFDSEVSSPSSTQVVHSSSHSVVPPVSDDCPQGPLPRSGHPSYCRSSPIARNAKTLSFPQSCEKDETSLATGTIVTGGQSSGGEETSSTGKNAMLALREEHEGKYGATGTKVVGANTYQGLDALSPHSTSVLAGLCSPSEPTSSTEQTNFPPDLSPIDHPPRTPSRTLKSSVTHPDFSRSTVQRPVIAPTPVRADDGPRKLNSPVKPSFEVDSTSRTPAQRVPIETAVIRRTSQVRRTAQITAGSDQTGRFLAIRAPVFTRPALDDPSRSPAKRIPVADFVASPAKGDQVPGSPTRISLRARSASVEPRPLRPILARSRSVEPSAIISKPDNRGKNKESIFPAVPVLPKSSTKLPFPLVPSQKPSSDQPPPIAEEQNTVGIRSAKTHGHTTSQLRQASTSSRIPRIGSKPYARLPPKSGDVTVGTTTANMAHALRPPPFRLVCKDNGAVNNNTEVPFAQPTNDHRLVGSLKRKRGAEAIPPSNSHSIMIRQVVPGILSEKYAPKPARPPSHVQSPPESSLPKVLPTLKFRKVVDGMLSARYPPPKANHVQPEPSDHASRPLSPLSELSSSSSEEAADEKHPPTAHPLAQTKTTTSDISRTDGDSLVVDPSACEHSSPHQDADDIEPSTRPRRTSRTRKPAQQQYVLDVFSNNTSTWPPPERRKPRPRMEGDCFMGMSATALKALTASNTTKNQQTVAVLATEVIRKEGLRPESPTVKARTILQKQRDERDVRRRERAQRRARMSEESLGASDTEGQTKLDDQVSSAGARPDHDENDYAMPRKHCRGPGDDEDYETPERPERVIEPLRLEGMDPKAKPVKQVKWHRGLSTAVYLDEADSRPKSLPKDVIARGCLAPTSKSLLLDPLGNLVDIDNRPTPELTTERIIVKRYLYDNDIEPEPVPVKMTRSKSKRSKS